MFVLKDKGKQDENVEPFHECLINSMYGSLKFTESVLQMVNQALSVVGGEMSWIMQFTLLAQSFWMKRVKYSCAFVQTSQQYC